MRSLRIIFFGLIISFAVTFCFAQSGGNFTIEKNVLATGGGTVSGGTITIAGTAGQPSAGFSSGGAFFLFGGFVTPDLAPTASSVSVSGRLVVSSGAGVTGAIIRIVDPNGATRSQRTGAFGYFRFDDVEIGTTYIISVESKRFQFAPQVVTVNDQIDELIFVSIP